MYITNKQLKALDFTTMEEYFQYIVDSIINGQKKQAKELFEGLSKGQKVTFYSWIGSSKEKGLTLIEVLDVVNV